MGLSNHTSRRGRMGGACNRRDRRCPALHVKTGGKRPAQVDKLLDRAHGSTVLQVHSL